jgi:hypothetical protein
VDELKKCIFAETGPMFVYRSDYAAQRAEDMKRFESQLIEMKVLIKALSDNVGMYQNTINELILALKKPEGHRRIDEV